MMEPIKNLLKSLFEKAEYETIECSESLLYKNKRYPDFWIIVDELDINKQNVLFYSLKKFHEQYKEMEKNSTVLLLNNSDANFKLSDSQCIELENDPCFFKKNVLTYKTATVVKLVDTLNAEKAPNLSSFLFDEKSYENMMKGDDVALLAYSIAQKLPFIMMDISVQEYEFKCESFYNNIDKENRNLIDEICKLKPEKFDEYIEKKISCKENENEI